MNYDRMANSIPVWRVFKKVGLHTLITAILLGLKVYTSSKIVVTQYIY